jgi:hypothetical protein
MLLSLLTSAASLSLAVASCPYTATCNAGGVEGICVSVSDNCCSGILTSGLCPGSNDIKCCTKNSCSTPNGSGTCLSKSSCTGTSYSGYCSGPSDLQCCVTNDEGNIFGENPYYYSNWCSAASLEYLDDANCVKKFPSSYDREWRCPVHFDQTELEGFVPLDTPLSEVKVDLSALASIVDPQEANICLIVVRRSAEGKAMNKSVSPSPLSHSLSLSLSLSVSLSVSLSLSHSLCLCLSLSLSHSLFLSVSLSLSLSLSLSSPYLPPS